jgi:hypothetical protein
MLVDIAIDMSSIFFGPLQSPPKLAPIRCAANAAERQTHCGLLSLGNAMLHDGVTQPWETWEGFT